jgi:hypothetical protein
MNADDESTRKKLSHSALSRQDIGGVFFKEKEGQWENK